MSTTVYIWKPGKPNDWQWKLLFHGRLGHASMQIGNRYYSFWPQTGRSGDPRKEYLGIGKSMPAVFKNRKEDFDGMGFNPDIEVPIQGLNEQKVIDFWSEVKNNQSHYHLIALNCCVTVSLALYEGFINTRQGQKVLASGDITPTFLDIHRRTEAAIKSVRSNIVRVEWESLLTPRLVGFYATMIDLYLKGKIVSDPEERKIVDWIKLINSRGDVSPHLPPLE